MTNKPLDVDQRIRVILTGEADGVAGTARTGRAPNAVDIVFRVLRQIEIEHMTHIRYVQPARRHIGGYQHWELAFGKLLQQMQPLFLWHVAGQASGIDTVGLQPHA